MNRATAIVASLTLACALAGPLAAQTLELKRVVLSQGGVGYFEYEARVAGDATLSLTLRRDQIDDVLKSIDVKDDKGGIGGVQLPGEAPVEQAFRDLPFGRDALASPAALLNALQGAEIAITRPRALKGRVMQVLDEAVNLPDRGGMVTRHRVTLMTAEGMQQFILEEADAVTFADATIQGEVNRALDAVARSRGGERRDVAILSKGTAERRVRVGYVVQTPLWKTSYRLTLGADQAADKGRLQGWAVIENLSGQDWREVELTLVSGSPVTFRQALYRAYFIDRPEVPVEVVGRILPRLDEGAVLGGRLQGEAPSQGAAARAEEERSRRMGQMAPQAMARMAPAPAASPPPPPPPPPEAAGSAIAVGAAESMAQVSFRFGQPISVASGQSFVIPIVDGDVAAERLALYQRATHERHPLAALRLKNEVESGLPPGVLTLYERGGDGAVAFVGDARMGPVGAGERRLLSFALDTRTIVDRNVEDRQTLAQGSIASGLFRFTRTDRQTTTYKIAAPPREPRRMIIEHPRSQGWRLATPEEKAAELTAGAYRFTVALTAGETKSLAVTLERPRIETLRLAEMNPQQLVAFASSNELSPELRKAFAEMQRLQRDIEASKQAHERLKSERQGIVQDQSRLRDNLARVPSGGDLHKRYLDRLGAQENRLDQLLAATDTAEKAVEQATAALADYIAKLAL